MQIWVHDNKMRKITALNNDIPNMLSYYNSSWHRYLAKSTNTFDFTIAKRYNGKIHDDIKLIDDTVYFSFKYQGRFYVFYVANIVEDDSGIQLTCNDTNLELCNEQVAPFSSGEAHTIQWYLEKMELLSFASIAVGSNEISDNKRTLTFESQETKLSRLQSLMSRFDAEYEFVTELKNDGTCKQITLNIYHEPDDSHHGVGKVRGDVVLQYGNDVKGVQVTTDKTQLFNMGVFTGQDGLAMNDVERSDKNEDGEEEFYTRKGSPAVYAPLSAEKYPATLRDGDNWTRKDFQTEYTNINDLTAYAFKTIKQYAYPIVTYTASVQSNFVNSYSDLTLGDTVKIYDPNFTGGLALRARISEQVISFDNPNNNTITFSNYFKLKNVVSVTLQKRMEELIEAKAPYIIRLSTNNGYIFKNGEGSSTITARLEKYSKDIAATWKWVVDNKVVGTGDKLTVKAEQVTNTMAVTVIAYVNGNEVVRDYMTFSNSDDGVGVESIDRYFTSSDQSDGVTIEGAEWSDKPPAPTEDGKYLWAYDEITYTDGTVTTTKPAAVGANFDVDAFRAEIAEDLKDVPNREEFENKIAEELANSKAEIETQIETAKTQAETNAKEYADTINQETAGVAEQAKTATDEIKADLVNVKNNLTATSLVANNAQASVDEAKQDLAEVASDLNTAKQDLANSVTAVNTKVDSTKAELTQAKQDLTSHAQQLQTQANAQAELTKRVTTVESTANGTKTTVNELSKTVAQNGKDITSVTARTKTVEDDLTSTKTTLSQVKTTADSASQKTATLESGLNGLSAKFDNLNVGGTNLIKQSTAQKGLRLAAGAGTFSDSKHELTDWIKIEPSTVYTLTTYEDVNEAEMYYSLAWYSTNNADYSGWISRPTGAATAADLKGGKQYKSPANATYAKVSYPINYPKVKFERGNVSTDYSQNGVDLEQKVAEYKQTADQNYASLQTTVQNLDGTVTANKATADQTAQGFSTRIESLETYKDGESTRANQYFELAKTETARQLTAERTAIAKDYVAKSTYTSDVTGIRNDLTATTTTANTTKTNLANYQASNDKVVASLKSSLQTTDGNVSNLQTKVEAVPGQITSAVSAVEGKIPTSVGGTNLLLYSADPSKAPTGYYDFTSAQKTSETYNGSVVYKMRGIWSGIRVNLGNLVDRDLLKVGDVLTYSVAIRAEQKSPIQARLFVRYTNQSDADSPTNKIELVDLTTNWQYVSITFTVTAKMLAENTKVTYLGWELTSSAESGKYVYYACNKIERGNVATDWSPAPEDTVSQISSLSSQIQQTKDGMTLLATKTELNTAKNELQSGIGTATNKANAAQNTANSAQSTANSAQNTANSNAQTISTHTTQISALNSGLQAKVSQTDFNTLSGRVTTAENNITAKANELSSKITSVEGKIPTSVGGTNLLLYSVDPWKAPSGYYQFDGVTKTDKTLNGSTVYKTNTAWTSLRLNLGKQLIDRRIVKIGEEFTYSVWMRTDQVPMNVRLFARFLGQSGADRLTGDIALTNDWQKFSVTFKVTEKMVTSQTKLSWVGFEQTTNNESGKYVYYACNKLERGNIATGYSPAPEDTATQINSLSSEFKQTTDAIKASVSSLDKSTVKSSSLTINADGIVMKAGKSTTDVANAIGSYFAVNQNAINLFSDKINVKGNMIVSGAITSDKIASKQINTAHLNGKIITADVISSNAVTADAIKAGAVTTDKMSANSINGDRITAGTLDAAKIKAGSITASQIASGTITSAQIKAGTISAVNIAAGTITGDNIKANSVDVSKIVGIDATYLRAKIETAMVDWLKGKTIVADNGATKIDLLSGYINFDSDTPAIRRVTPGIPTQFIKFLKSDNNSVTTIGSNRDGSESSMNDSFAGIKITSGDLIEQTEIISDQIYFFTGAANRQGWQMATVSGDDHRQITLFPSGNPTKSNIYASDYFIRGSNGWVNLLDFIDYFNACLKHLQNHTGRYDIWNGFKI